MVSCDFQCPINWKCVCIKQTRPWCTRIEIKPRLMAGEENLKTLKTEFPNRQNSVVLRHFNNTSDIESVCVYFMDVYRIFGDLLCSGCASPRSVSMSGTNEFNALYKYYYFHRKKFIVSIVRCGRHMILKVNLLINVRRFNMIRVGKFSAVKWIWVTVIYTFGQKVVPANDIIIKFMAAACITRQMIYVQRLVATK